MNAASIITLAAIDDDRMLLGGLTAWLDPVTDLQLTLTCATVADYEARLDGGATVPHVVLLDLNLRDQSSPADNVRRVLASGALVIMVSTIPDADGVLATMEAGAAGYLTKDQDLEALLTAVREVAAGGSALSPELAFMISRDSRPHRPQLSAQELSLIHI